MIVPVRVKPVAHAEMVVLFQFYFTMCDGLKGFVHMSGSVIICN